MKEFIRNIIKTHHRIFFENVFMSANLLPSLKEDDIWAGRIVRNGSLGSLKKQKADKDM